MKKYIEPIIEIEIVELDDTIASSGQSDEKTFDDIFGTTGE